MNTEDSEFARIEREQAMRGVPDAIHHTDPSETMEYIQGWNDCRQAMLAEQPAQQEPVYYQQQYGDVVGTKEVRILYTPQAQSKPLTDKQILADETLRYYFGQNGGAGPVSKQGRKVVDAIEAAHGIKENT